MAEDCTTNPLLESLPTSVDQLSTLFDALKAAGEKGQTLAQFKNIAPQDLERLYGSAMTLCERAQWQEAGQIALQLALHDLRDSRYLYLAGICLQRLHEFPVAAGLFGLSLIDSDHPVVPFRMGECLAAMGEFDKAREAFDVCLDMCRGNAGVHDLQDACDDALSKLTRH